MNEEEQCLAFQHRSFFQFSFSLLMERKKDDEKAESKFSTNCSYFFVVDLFTSSPLLTPLPPTIFVRVKKELSIILEKRDLTKPMFLLDFPDMDRRRKYFYKTFAKPLSQIIKCLDERPKLIRAKN